MRQIACESVWEMSQTLVDRFMGCIAEVRHHFLRLVKHAFVFAMSSKTDFFRERLGFDEAFDIGLCYLV